MSAQPIAGPAAGDPSSALAAGERVQQLQALIAQVEFGVPNPTLPSTTTPSFAETLNAAQTSSAIDSGPTAAADASPTGAENTYAQPGQAVYAGPTERAVYPASWSGASGSTALTSPGTSSTTGSGDGAYEPLIAQTAAQYGLDPAILHGLIEQESGFDPAARSSAGALGLTQLMPGTAASLGVTEPLDPAQSIAGGARYLSEQMQRFGGNTADALAAYNAGPGAVQSYGGVPPYPETQEYVSKVLGYAAAYRQTAPSPATAQAPDPSTATAQTTIPSTAAGAVA
jgi:soluble lytic murein transglycosylase-like protein